MHKKRWVEKLEALKLALKWTYQASPFLTVVDLCFVALGGLLAIAEPYAFKLVIDYVTKQQSIMLGIVGILSLYGVARLLQNLFWDLTNLIRRVHNLHIERYVIHTLMAKISSLDMIYFETAEYYNTVDRATGNLWRILELFWVVTFFLSEVISTIVIIGALIAYDVRLVGILLFSIIPSLFVVWRWADVLYSAFQEASPIYRHARYYQSLLTDDPASIRELRVFGIKEHFLGKFAHLFTDFIKKQDTAARIQIFWYILLGIIEGCLSVFAAWLVVESYMEGKITLGDLSFLWMLLFQFAGHIRWIVRMLGDLNTHTTFLTPVLEVLHFTPTIQEISQPKKFPLQLKQGIEFRNVSFSYPHTKKHVLKDISLSFKPNENIALVGENGSGKSTLIKLLCRLYDVSTGEICIDGNNIKEFALDDLYNHIGIIFQDFMKYEALIEENIGLGRLGKKEGIHEAAVKSGSWPFIKELEKQYKTHIGKKLKEEGVELSVGQWQKIALARAFFRDAQILILDEPTAAVDAKAEYELFRKFKALTKNKITFLISHRFSTVRMADKIVVIDKGRIIEVGSHDELMRNNGHYAKLFRMQARGYE